MVERAVPADRLPSCAAEPAAQRRAPLAPAPRPLRTRGLCFDGRPTPSRRAGRDRLWPAQALLTCAPARAWSRRVRQSIPHGDATEGDIPIAGDSGQVGAVRASWPGHCQRGHATAPTRVTACEVAREKSLWRSTTPRTPSLRRRQPGTAPRADGRHAEAAAAQTSDGAFRPVEADAAVGLFRQARPSLAAGAGIRPGSPEDLTHSRPRRRPSRRRRRTRR